MMTVTHGIVKEFCSGVNKSGASSEGILKWSERMRQ